MIYAIETRAVTKQLFRTIGMKPVYSIAGKMFRDKPRRNEIRICDVPEIIR